ncbi:MAG: single-stranded-DNA-specific exonuclease RecJ, partial [Myxococcota bacterium]|nr:single-stranded-DNA-specific exonuclease RecJ [Myxococcota bacterium]
MYRTGPKVWSVLEPRAELVNALIEGLPTDPLIARLHVNRGVKDVDSARRYLHPSFDDLHDPFLLATMEQA